MKKLQEAKIDAEVTPNEHYSENKENKEGNKHQKKKVTSNYVKGVEHIDENFMNQIEDENDEEFLTNTYKPRDSNGYSNRYQEYGTGIKKKSYNYKNYNDLEDVWAIVTNPNENTNEGEGFNEADNLGAREKTYVKPKKIIRKERVSVEEPKKIEDLKDKNKVVVSIGVKNKINFLLDGQKYKRYIWLNTAQNLVSLDFNKAIKYYYFLIL